MNWDIQDVVEYLQNTYVRLTNNLREYERNDNEVDMDYTKAKLDFIVDMLKDITGGTYSQVCEDLSDLIDGVFWFDPNDDPSFYPINKGTVVCVMKDILYCSLTDLQATYDEDDQLELLEEYLYEEDGNVYVPAGTYMKFLGLQPGAANWPYFDMHGFEIMFAGDPFKLKKVK